jgi:hypothetical protein
MVWVDFGCPVHGKGPWDGLGDMAKSKVTLDIIHDKECIDSPDHVGNASGSALTRHLLQQGLGHGAHRQEDSAGCCDVSQR